MLSTVAVAGSELPALALSAVDSLLKPDLSKYNTLSNISYHKDKFDFRNVLLFFFSGMHH